MTITLVGNGLSFGIKYLLSNRYIHGNENGKSTNFVSPEKAYSILCLTMVCDKLNVPKKIL